MPDKLSNGASVWKAAAVGGMSGLATVCIGIAGCLWHDIDNHAELPGHQTAIARIKAVEDAVVEIKADTRTIGARQSKMDTTLGVINTKLDRLLGGG